MAGTNFLLISAPTSSPALPLLHLAVLHFLFDMMCTLPLVALAQIYCAVCLWTAQRFLDLPDLDPRFQAGTARAVLWHNTLQRTQRTAAACCNASLCAVLL